MSSAGFLKGEHAGDVSACDKRHLRHGQSHPEITPRGSARGPPLRHLATGRPTTRTDTTCGFPILRARWTCRAHHKKREIAGRTRWPSGARGVPAEVPPYRGAAPDYGRIHHPVRSSAADFACVVGGGRSRKKATWRPTDPGPGRLPVPPPPGSTLSRLVSEQNGKRAREPEAFVFAEGEEERRRAAAEFIFGLATPSWSAEECTEPSKLSIERSAAQMQVPHSAAEAAPISRRSISASSGAACCSATACAW